MNNKYEITDETKEWYGRTLHQIKALSDFGDVKAGDLGGWIEKESNLAQEGNCWVSGNAQVFGNAQISDDAWVSGNAQIFGNARVRSFHDICIMSSFGSQGRTTTAFRCKDKFIKVNCGCFNGTLAEFEKRVDKTHGNAHYGREYKTMIELIKVHFEDSED
jgi:hypothetical protein